MANDEKKKPAPAAAPAAPAAPSKEPARAVADELADQLVRDLAHAFLVAPPRHLAIGQAPPPSPAECIQRARRIVGDLVPLMQPSDVDALDVVFAQLGHGISPALALTIGREWLALQAQLVAPE